MILSFKSEHNEELSLVGDSIFSNTTSYFNRQFLELCGDR